MGAFKGTISYTLYHVDGDLPDGYRDEFMERIREFKFIELTPHSEEDTSFGWCVVDQLLSQDFSLVNVFHNEYLCLGFRMDRWSLPSALFKARLAQRSEEYKREYEKVKLSRTEKDALRDQVILELKEQMLPAAAMTDMVWNLEEKTLRFWSTSKRANEAFLELFESTFALRLVPTSPYIEAVECGLNDEMVGRLADVEPADFVRIS